MARSTIEELIEEVQDIIQDKSQTNDEIVLKYFNRALQNFANVYIIPDLCVVGTVDTVVGANVAPLPDNFHKGLKTCFNLTTNKHVRVHNSRSLIDRRMGRVNKVGNLVGVAKEGINLYYQRKPASVETLQLSYYSLPDDVSDTFPSYVPDDILDKLFINYACQYIYSKLEDGMEGEKVNTAYHKGEYREAFAEAKRYFGDEEDEPYIPLENNAFSGSFDFNALM